MKHLMCDHKVYESFKQKSSIGVSFFIWSPNHLQQINIFKNTGIIKIDFDFKS